MEWGTEHIQMGFGFCGRKCKPGEMLSESVSLLYTEQRCAPRPRGKGKRGGGGGGNRGKGCVGGGGGRWRGKVQCVSAYPSIKTRECTTSPISVYSATVDRTFHTILWSHTVISPSLMSRNGVDLTDVTIM